MRVSRRRNPPGQSRPWLRVACNFAPQKHIHAAASTSRRKFRRAHLFAGPRSFWYRRKSLLLHAGLAAPPNEPPETRNGRKSASSRRRQHYLGRSIDKKPIAAMILIQQPQGFWGRRASRPQNFFSASRKHPSSV